MSNYFNIELWLEFIDILFRGIYPIIFILVIIAFIHNWRKFLKNKYSRLLIILFLICFLVRFLKLFSQGWLSERYLESIILILTPFAAKGLYDFTKILNYKIIKKKYKISTNRLFILFLIIIAVIMMGKVLRPHWDKPWLFSLNTVINKKQPRNTKRIIITNDDDIRLAYSTNSAMIVIKLNPFRFENNQYIVSWDKDESDMLKFKFEAGIRNIYKNISTLGYKHVYLFLNRVNPNEFNELFISNSLPFKFKLLKEYKDRHGRPVCFYEYLN
ncbi:MAG TPA: hypothetical protein QF753_06595 [Victivallales bacterium]|nr:hypothetical protein [Victivallales bacterium]